MGCIFAKPSSMPAQKSTEPPRRERKDEFVKPTVSRQASAAVLSKQASLLSREDISNEIINPQHDVVAPSERVQAPASEDTCATDSSPVEQGKSNEVHTPETTVAPDEVIPIVVSSDE